MVENILMRFVQICETVYFSENLHLFKSLTAESLAVNMLRNSAVMNISTVLDSLKRNNHTRIGVFLQFDCAASIHVIRAVSIIPTVYYPLI